MRCTGYCRYGEVYALMDSPPRQRKVDVVEGWPLMEVRLYLLESNVSMDICLINYTEITSFHYKHTLKVHQKQYSSVRCMYAVRGCSDFW